MKVLVIDGQGGGIGRLLVEKLRARQPGQAIIAVGTNALATSAMLRAGADAGATGENAVRFNCQDAGLILGPSGIQTPDAMLGEISPQMAEAVMASKARKLLLPMEKCGPVRQAGRAPSMDALATALVAEAVAYIQREDAV